MTDWDRSLASVRKAVLQGKTQAARAALDALRQTGSVPECEQWRVHELYGAVFHDLADAEGVAAAYSNAARADKYLRSQREHFSNVLFALHYLPDISAEDLLQQHLVYQSLYRDTEPLPAGGPFSHERLRIGFLAPDFRDSSSARFYECLLTGLDACGFAVYAYALEDAEDAFTRRIQAAGVMYRCLAGSNLLQMAESIRRDEVDVLMDLGGHSAGGLTLMVMAERPARVQLCGIGWFDTTGLSAIDFFLTDAVMAPAGTEKYFTETLLRLPQAFCFTPTAAMQKIRRQKRQNRHIVFGSLQNVMKINDKVLAAWRAILQAMPDSRLIVQDTTKRPARCAAVKERLARAGLPMARVAVRLGSDRYLEDYGQMDIMLDTFPYTGGVAVATALYMGVPVVSLRGDHYSARLSASILTAAGHPEWLAEDGDDYSRLALRLAADPIHLEKIQLRLREELEDSKLLAAKSYVKHFAQAVIQRTGSI